MLYFTCGLSVIWHICEDLPRRDTHLIILVALLHTNCGAGTAHAI